MAAFDDMAKRIREAARSAQGASAANILAGRRPVAQGFGNRVSTQKTSSSAVAQTTGKASGSKTSGTSGKQATEQEDLLGTWHLTQAMDESNEQLELDAATKKACSIIIRSASSATMSFPDGTFIGSVRRSPESDMSYADAWNHYTAQAYTFRTTDSTVEIEFGYIVRNDNSQRPFIVMPIDSVNYYYDK